MNCPILTVKGSNLFTIKNLDPPRNSSLPMSLILKHLQTMPLGTSLLRPPSQFQLRRQPLLETNRVRRSMGNLATWRHGPVSLRAKNSFRCPAIMGNFLPVSINHQALPLPTLGHRARLPTVLVASSTSLGTTAHRDTINLLLPSLCNTAWLDLGTHDHVTISYL